MIVAALAIGIAALVFALIGFALGIVAVVQVEAMKRSTHKIQYVDPWKTEMEEAFGDTAPEFEPVTKKRKEELKAKSDQAFEDADLDEEEIA